MKKYLLITTMLTLACIYTFAQDVVVIDDFTGNTSSGIGKAFVWVNGIDPYVSGTYTISYQDNQLRSDFSLIHSLWFPRVAADSFTVYHDFSKLSMMVIKFLVTDGVNDSMPVRFDLYGDGAEKYNDTIRKLMETNGKAWTKTVARDEWVTDSTDFRSNNRFYCTYWKTGIAPIRIDSTKMKGFEAFVDYGDAMYDGMTGTLLIDYIKMRKPGTTAVKTIYGSENAFGLAVYPTSGNNYLNVNAEKRISVLRVIDLTGKTLILRNNVNERKLQLNISSFKTGIYVVSAIDMEGNQVSRKVYIK